MGLSPSRREAGGGSFYEREVEMKKHGWGFKVWIASALLVFVASIAVSLLGCMTPAQQKAFNGAMNAAAKAEAVVEKLDGEIKIVKKAIEEKKIDPADGMKLIAAYKEHKAEAVAAFDENKAAMAEMKKNELPWYAYALYGVNILNAVAGGTLGYGKVSGVIKAFGTLSRGTEEIINALGDGKETVSSDDALKILGGHAAKDSTGSTLKVLHHDSLAGTI